MMVIIENLNWDLFAAIMCWERRGLYIIISIIIIVISMRAVDIRLNYLDF